MRKRYELSYFKDFRQILNQKKYEKKVFKLEDFIDDCYSSEQFNFKQMIQNEKMANNLINDFFKFQNLLVCLLKLLYIFQIKQQL